MDVLYSESKLGGSIINWTTTANLPYDTPTEVSQGSIGGNEVDHGTADSPPPSPSLHPASTRAHLFSPPLHQFVSEHRSAFVPVGSQDSR